MKQIFSFLLIIFSINSFGQTPKQILDNYIEKYEFSKVVQLEKNTLIEIDINKNDELDIIETEQTIDLILDKNATFYNEEKVQYSEFYELNYIDAKSFYPEEKKYKEYKVSEDDHITKDKVGGWVFHDDVKEVSFMYPKLVQGSKRYLETQHKLTEPKLLSSFYFQSYIPTEEAKLQIILDENVELGYKLFNTDTFNIQYTKEEKKGKVIHTWIAKDVNEYEYESAAPSLSNFLPHIILFIKGYKTKDTEVKGLASVADLHDWYTSLIKDLNTQENHNLKTIVDSLVLESDTEIEKVQKIYSWVQTHIKYIAFEDGYGGFIPREAVDICEKRYGDCKDMASIITEMLEIANVKADLTWIGTRKIPYTYEEVYTPSVDNHMIASYTSPTGEIIYLDATSNYLPFGMVSEFIQGKQAMINVGEGKYKLAFVPETAAEKNYIYDSVFISLEDKKIVGNGKLTLTGYPKVDMSYDFPNLTDKEKKNLIKNNFEKGNNKFIVSATKDFNFNERDLPSVVEYDFEIQDYVNSSGYELYINLFLDKYMKGQDIDEDRVYPKEIDYKYVYEQVVSLTIPANYKVDYIPENAENTNEKFSFSINYEQKNNQIILHSKFIGNALLINYEDFDAWNKLIKELNSNYSEVVILKKK